jgi:protein MpaA
MTIPQIITAWLPALLLAGCGSGPAPDAGRDVAPAAMATGQNEGERVVEIGRSVDGHPIVMHVFGSAPRPILILGGLHGNEQNSALCAALLLEHLRGHPADRGGVSIALIPAANPDGLDRGIRFNVHRVDLNRNFPAVNWIKMYSGGRAAASEPETRALVETIGHLQPRRILSIHSILGKPCNNYDGPAVALAYAMAAKNGYPAKDSIGYPTPGSLGSWAGVDQHIPIITLELPFALPGQESWERNHQAILAFIRGAE